jgi:hypothetical protein
MKRSDRLRKDALRRYFVFRMKLIEVFHFVSLWSSLDDEEFIPENVMEHDGSDYAESVRTALLGWFCTIVDQSGGGLNVLNVWRQLFPKHRKKIDALWKEIEPHWEILKNFRDKCAFHADTPKHYFAAKQRIIHNPQVAKAVQDMLDVAKFFINKEDEELPDFVPEVESCLFDLERELDIRINRDALKRLLILRRGNYKKVFS